MKAKLFFKLFLQWSLAVLVLFALLIILPQQIPFISATFLPYLGGIFFLGIYTGLIFQTIRILKTVNQITAAPYLAADKRAATPAIGTIGSTLRNLSVVFGILIILSLSTSIPYIKNGIDYIAAQLVAHAGITLGIVLLTLAGSFWFVAIGAIILSIFCVFATYWALKNYGDRNNLK